MSPKIPTLLPYDTFIRIPYPALPYPTLHVHLQYDRVFDIFLLILYLYYVHVRIIVCAFVGCCLATRGVRGLLWAKGWVWLTELASRVARQQPTKLLIGDAFTHAAH